MPKNNTHEKDLKIFSDHCEYWIKKFGLFDWDWRCAIDDDDDSTNANVLLNPDGRKAYISLCTNREDVITIEQLAKHEVCEILLADVGLMLEKYYPRQIVDDEIHKIINRLVRVL